MRSIYQNDVTVAYKAFYNRLALTGFATFMHGRFDRLVARTIQGDLLLSTVTGSISGTSAGSSGSTPNQYSVTLSSSSVSLFPGFTMVLKAREYSLVTPPRSLYGTYKQALCGYSSDLENGQYVLSKQ